MENLNINWRAILHQTTKFNIISLLVLTGLNLILENLHSYLLFQHNWENNLLEEGETWKMVWTPNFKWILGAEITVIVSCILFILFCNEAKVDKIKYGAESLSFIIALLFGIYISAIHSFWFVDQIIPPIGLLNTMNACYIVTGITLFLFSVSCKSTTYGLRFFLIFIATKTIFYNLDYTNLYNLGIYLFYGSAIFIIARATRFIYIWFWEKNHDFLQPDYLERKKREVEEKRKTEEERRVTDNNVTV